MTPDPTPLESLQSAVAARLSADEWFSGARSANGAAVPVITEQRGDIATAIATALGSLGLCLVVTTPVFEFLNPQIPQSDGTAALELECREMVTINQGKSGTQIHALAAAQRVVSLLHFWPHSLPNTCEPQAVTTVDAAASDWAGSTVALGVQWPNGLVGGERYWLAGLGLLLCAGALRPAAVPFTSDPTWAGSVPPGTPIPAGTRLCAGRVISAKRPIELQRGGDPANPALVYLVSFNARLRLTDPTTL